MAVIILGSGTTPVEGTREFDPIPCPVGGGGGTGGITFASGDADNYVLTSTGVGNEIQGESNLQFNGSTLTVTGAVDISGTITVDTIASGVTQNILSYNTGTGTITYNASGGGSTNFLRADGTWAVPAGTYVHPNHTGQITSVADGVQTLDITAITDQIALTSGLVSTDEFLMNDGGALKRMDVSVLEGYMQSNLTFGTVTSVASGNGMNFSSITTTGTVTMGTPSTLNTSTTNTVTSTSHSHAIEGFAEISGTPSGNEVAVWLSSTDLGSFNTFKYDGTDLTVNDNIIIPATGRIYLDGGSDTFIKEGVADIISFISGGDTILTLANTSVGILRDIGPTPTDTLDIGSNTYWWKDIYVQKYYIDDTATYIYNNSGDLEFVDAANSGGVTLSELVAGTVSWGIDDQIPVMNGTTDFDYDANFSYSSSSVGLSLGSFSSGDYAYIRGNTQPSVALQSNDVANMTLRVYSNTATKSMGYRSYRYGGTIASPAAAPTDADILYSSYFLYDGSTASEAARYAVEVDGAVSVGSFNTKQSWWIRGGASMTERMILSNNGLQLNDYGGGAITGTPTYSLAVDSSGNIIEDTPVSSVISFGSQYQIPYVNATTDDFDYGVNFTWDSNYLRIGTGGNPVVQLSHTGAYKITVVEEVDNTAFSINNYSNTANVANRFSFNRYGGAIGSAAAVPTNGVVHYSDYYVHDGTSLLIGGRYYAEVDGTVSTNDFDFKYTWSIKNGVAAAADVMQLSTSGLQLHDYGSGSITGTATYMLGVDASGNLIEETISSTVSFGASNQIPYTNATTNDFDYSANLTFDGSTLDVTGAITATTDITLGSSNSIIYGSTDYRIYRNATALYIAVGGNSSMIIGDITTWLYGDFRHHDATASYYNFWLFNSGDYYNILSEVTNDDGWDFTISSGLSSSTTITHHGGDLYFYGGSQIGAGGGRAGNVIISGGTQAGASGGSNGGDVKIFGGASISGDRGQVYLGNGSFSTLQAKGSETNVVYYNTTSGLLTYGVPAGGGDVVVGSGDTATYVAVFTDTNEITGYSGFTFDGTDLTLDSILNFTDTNTQIWEDGSSNLTFKDSVTGTKTLAELAASSYWNRSGGLITPATSGDSVDIDGGAGGRLYLDNSENHYISRVSSTQVQYYVGGADIFNMYNTGSSYWNTNLLPFTNHSRSIGTSSYFWASGYFDRVSFKSSSTYILEDVSSNLSFTDGVTGTKTLAEVSDDQERVVHVIKAQVLYTNTSQTTIVTLPEDAVIWDIQVDVITIFNGSAPQDLDIGTSSSGERYAADNDVDITSATWQQTPLTNIPDRMTGSTDIVFQYTDGGGSSAGEAYIYIHYSLH